MSESFSLKEGHRYPLCDGELCTENSLHKLKKFAVDELLAATFLPAAMGREEADGGFDDADIDPDEAEAEPNGYRHVVSLGRNGKVLHVGNLVGAFVLPCGAQVEIVPKVSPADPHPVAARLSLRRMWSYAMDLALRDHSQTADVEIERDLPIHEWLLRRFMTQATNLVAKGLRSQYLEEQDNLLTMRGRLLVGENIRRNAFAAHRFVCRFDEFSLNRPENRLIRSALDVVARETSKTETGKMALALRERMHEIPPSKNVSADLAAWRNDRTMFHYREIRQTCEWLLQRKSSTPVGGTKQAWGRVVRMNDVFERYVVRWLSENSGSGFHVVGQGRGSHEGTMPLATADDGRNTAIHTMRPDMVLRGEPPCNKAIGVYDVKWKITDRSKPFSREDLYQLFSYAKHWLPDGGCVGAIYPTADKEAAAEKYQFPNFRNLKLHKIYFRIPQISCCSTRWDEGPVDNSFIQYV